MTSNETPSKSEDQSERIATEEGAATSRAKSGRGESHDPRQIYVYPTSGIAERSGAVPIWLWIVAASLSIWGLYYLVVYWNPSAAS
jgi:hypothetical protein